MVNVGKHIYIYMDFGDTQNFAENLKIRVYIYIYGRLPTYNPQNGVRSLVMYSFSIQVKFESLSQPWPGEK